MKQQKAIPKEVHAYRVFISNAINEGRISSIHKKSNRDIVVKYKSGVENRFVLFNSKITNSEKGKFSVKCYRDVFGDFKNVDLSKLKPIEECNLSVFFGEKPKDKKKFYRVDINRCYFNTAKILGFISNENYEKYNTKEYKFSTNVAVGCCARTETKIDYLDSGVRVVTKIKNSLEIIRANILDYVCCVYSVVASQCKVVWFHTDCFYLTRKKDIAKCQNILAKFGFTSKLEE